MKPDFGRAFSGYAQNVKTITHCCGVYEDVIYWDLRLKPSELADFEVVAL